MKIPALEQLQSACDELLEWNITTPVPEDDKPSALLLIYNPTDNPNARARIIGDPGALVQVLMMAARDPGNAEFAQELANGILQLIRP